MAKISLFSWKELILPLLLKQTFCSKCYYNHLTFFFFNDRLFSFRTLLSGFQSQNYHKFTFLENQGSKNALLHGKTNWLLWNKDVISLQKKIKNIFVIITVNHILKKHTYIFQSLQCFFLLTLKSSYRSTISNTQRLKSNYQWLKRK